MPAFPGDSEDGPDGAATPEVLARARRVGPDLGPEFRPEPDPDLEADAGQAGQREPEPWEVPLPPPPAPRLREQSVEEAFVTLGNLTLGRARAFLHAYRSIPRSELDLGGWAPGLSASAGSAAQPPTLDEIQKGRAVLREGAMREAGANSADRDAEPVAARARATAIEALSHAVLRGGALEEATVAAEVAAQDVVVALTLRRWIADWRFNELVEPWARAFAVEEADAHTFDALGALAIAFGVMAFAFTFGRSVQGTADLPGLVFATATILCLLARWRLRRTPAAG